jgi:hypothetical protein
MAFFGFTNIRAVIHIFNSKAVSFAVPPISDIIPASWSFVRRRVPLSRLMAHIILCMPPWPRQDPRMLRCPLPFQTLFVRAPVRIISTSTTGATSLTPAYLEANQGLQRCCFPQLLKSATGANLPVRDALHGPIHPRSSLDNPMPIGWVYFTFFLAGAFFSPHLHTLPDRSAINPAAPL